MPQKKEAGLATTRAARDPFAALREITSELDRVFEDPFGRHWPRADWPSLRAVSPREAGWAPQIDVFERNNSLITRIDLPGVKKEDVKVEVADGHLAISGERKSEREEKKDNVFRSERSCGSFYRAVPLPDGVSFDNVKATFTEGVLEVSVPLPAKVASKTRTVEIQDGGKPAKTAAA